MKIGDEVYIGHKVRREVEQGIITAIDTERKTADVKVTLFDEDSNEEYTKTRYVPLDWLHADQMTAYQNKSHFYYVNVYEANRAYGGSEEGGWWYDCGEPLTSHDRVAPTYGPFTDRSEANKRLEELKPLVEKINKDEKRYHPNSVLCTGYIECRVEETVGEAYPKERPHYG